MCRCIIVILELKKICRDLASLKRKGKHKITNFNFQGVNSGEIADPERQPTKIQIHCLDLSSRDIPRLSNTNNNCEGKHQFSSKLIC